MALLKPLPLPKLEAKTKGSISFITDDALASSVGVYMGFTKRGGGVSDAPFDSLNLGSHVGDDITCVQENRMRLMAAIGFGNVEPLVPNQVHGIELMTIENARCDHIGAVKDKLEAGADGIIVCASCVAALLCFADCVPVIIVSPTGNFAVLHAGWRGAIAGITSKALCELAKKDTRICGLTEDELRAQCNIYIGPCIRKDCFEVSEEIASRFEERFGKLSVPSYRHVDLPRVVAIDACNAGANEARICDSGICTVCSEDEFFSYRASGGTTGRHGAFAVRDGFGC